MTPLPGEVPRRKARDLFISGKKFARRRQLDENSAEAIYDTAPRRGAAPEGAEFIYPRSREKSVTSSSTRTKPSSPA